MISPSCALALDPVCVSLLRLPPTCLCLNTYNILSIYNIILVELNTLQHTHTHIQSVKIVAAVWDSLCSIRPTPTNNFIPPIPTARPGLSGHVPRRRGRARRALVALRLLLRIAAGIGGGGDGGGRRTVAGAGKCGGRRARPPDAHGGIVGDGGEHGRVDGVPADAVDGARVTDQLGQRLLAPYVPDVDLRRGIRGCC